VRGVARSHRARVAIVGGQSISITQAPWQVVVFAVLSETEALLCGGSILNSAEVLTAGHCMFNPNTRARIPADQIVVVAGTSDLKVANAGEQGSLVAAVRVHPYYA
jgi:secreted trypsin-like serine protease